MEEGAFEEEGSLEEEGAYSMGKIYLRLDSIER
jgi:hypothetical protein